MLLCDISKFEIQEILTETKGTFKKLKANGIFQRGNYVNQNNRVYKTETLKEAVGKIQDRIKTRALVGNLDHPIGSEEKVLQLLLTDASHLISKLKVDGNDVIGTLETLNTPNGHILSNLLEDEVYIGISLRGGGRITPTKFEGKNVDMVQSPLKIITYDAVANPSNAMAQLNMISESLHEYVDRCLFGCSLKSVDPQFEKNVLCSGLDLVEKIIKNL